MRESTKLVGRSAAALALGDEISCAARCDANVLITGEHGVGKETVAHVIHQRSTRRHRSLHTITCAGVPDSLLVSQLFDRVSGSASGAHVRMRGVLEIANGGTVFLDQVGELSPRLQAMLSRFLEMGTIQRKEEDGALLPLDVRVISATHRKLFDHVRDRTFRDDLYYRLNFILITIPPLRERRDDIPHLLRHALSLAATTHALPEPELPTAALTALTAYDWPGNVRELRTVCEGLVLQGSKAPSI